MNYIIFNWPDLAYIETSWQLLGVEVQILTSEYFFHLFSGVQQENGLLSGFYTLYLEENFELIHMPWRVVSTPCALSLNLD